MTTFLLPRPPTARESIVAEAVRRGLSLGLVARGLGTSHQAVSQALARYEARFGKITAAKRKTRAVPAPTKMWACRVCGQPRGWVSAKKIETHCSSKCFGQEARLLSPEQIRSAINIRLAGSLWKTTAKHFGTHVQTLQRDVWIFLHENDLLTVAMVTRIWARKPSEQRKGHSWEWLVRYAKCPMPRDDGLNLPRNLEQLLGSVDG